MLSRAIFFLRKAAILPIRVYQYCISPLFPAKCRFYPTCSSYAIEAITQHGVLKGFALSLWRVLRCHPWNKGGYDPVPHHCSLPFIKDR